METVGISRVLWRWRMLVAAGVVLALGIGALAVLHSKAVTSGYAWERVLIDTPKSQLVDLHAKGAESTVARAVIVSGLLESGEARERIAAETGVPSSKVGVVSSGSALPAVLSPLAEQSIEVTKPLQPYLITVSEEPNLPILSIVARTPDKASARELVEATRRTLLFAANRGPLSGSELRVKRLGLPEVSTKTVGSRKKAVLASAAFLLLWCFGVVVLDGFLRRRAGRRPSPPSRLPGVAA